MRLYSRRRWLLHSLVAAASLYLPACTRIPHRSNSGGLRMVFYTDVHAMAARGAADAVLIAAQAINQLKPDIIIGGGDYIDGGFDSTRSAMAPHWDIYMRMRRALEADHYPVIGNHDITGALIYADPHRDYRDRMGIARTWYAFDAGGYHFIMLDSMTIVGGELGYEGRIDAEQMAWLQSDLARTPKSTPIILTLHMPLLTNVFAATKGNSVLAPANRVMVDNLAILGLFAEHRLLLVLQGHLHVAEVIRWRNTTFITGGAVCANWWRGAYLGTEEGFYVIDLEGDKVNWQYVDYGWHADEV